MSTIQFATHRVIAVAMLALLVPMSTGCEEDGSRGTIEPPPAAVLPESRWRIDETNGQRRARVAIEHDEMQRRLAEAMEQAQSTAESARERWRTTAESQQHRWAVKWAARVADDEHAIEHVWVRPLHWSPFRIEGILLTAPDRALDASGGSPSRGDIVSFPTTELSDWVRWHNNETGGQRDGGFTIDALERAVGPAR